MSQPSKAALEVEVTVVGKDRLGRLIARRKGRVVAVPSTVRDLVGQGHDLADLWQRRPEFGGGERALPWFLRGIEPTSGGNL